MLQLRYAHVEVIQLTLICTSVMTLISKIKSVRHKGGHEPCKITVLEYSKIFR